VDAIKLQLSPFLPPFPLRCTRGSPAPPRGHFRIFSSPFPLRSRKRKKRRRGPLFSSLTILQSLEVFGVSLFGLFFFLPSFFFCWDEGVAQDLTLPSTLEGSFSPFFCPASKRFPPVVAPFRYPSGFNKECANLPPLPIYAAFAAPPSLTRLLERTPKQLLTGAPPLPLFFSYRPLGVARRRPLRTIPCKRRTRRVHRRPVSVSPPFPLFFPSPFLQRFDSPFFGSRWMIYPRPPFPPSGVAKKLLLRSSLLFFLAATSRHL